MNSGASSGPDGQSMARLAARERLLELGGEELLQAMTSAFLRNVPQRLESAVAGQAAGDLDSVERAAHSIKSSAANLGESELREIAERLERVARARNKAESRRLVPLLESAFAGARSHLESPKTT